MSWAGLISIVRPALEKLNPDLPAEALDAAAEELCRDRSAYSMVVANQQIYQLLKHGIKVKVENRREGGQETKVVRVIDWDRPEENDFLLGSQFKLDILRKTDRALIVSPGQNEIAQMADKGLDIRPHRERMVKEDLETEFKDPDAPLGLVFVCAMSELKDTDFLANFKDT